jgi:hypothetical protein
MLKADKKFEKNYQLAKSPRQFIFIPTTKIWPTLNLIKFYAHAGNQAWSLELTLLFEHIQGD